MRPRSSLLLALTLAACASSAPRSTVPPPATPTPAPGGDRAGLPPAEIPVVAARDPLPMPTCETGDLVALGTLTAGVPAMAAVARAEAGGLVAFLTDSNHDGNAELMVQPLDDAGQVRGAASAVPTGPHPFAPALVARGAGYLLAWREGNAGQERVGLRAFDARGTALPQAHQPGNGLAAGWLGAPALAAAGESAWLGVVRSRERPGDPDARTGDRLEVLALGDGTAGARSVDAPANGVFDALRPPVLVVQSAAVPVRALVVSMARSASAGDERAVLEATLGEPSSTLRVLARGVDAPAALATPGRTLLAWRARVASRDVAVRAFVQPAEGAAPMPPVTVATYRGAYGADVALAPLGEGLVGAFTVSTLADDAGGSLNVSVLTPGGELVGRRPTLVSVLTRSAHPALAARGGDVWAVVDGRGDAGSGPALVLTRIRCDAARPMDRLDVPPPSVVQQLSAPDEPPVSLASVPSAAQATCTATGAPTTFVRHVSATPDALAGTSAAAVPLARATVLFATVRAAAGQGTNLMVTTVDARGAVAAPHAALEGATELLATGAHGGSALAVARVGAGDAQRTMLVLVGADGRARPAVQLPVARATSAAIVRETGAVVLVGESEAQPGDSSLWVVPVTNGRAGSPVLAAALRPGDRVLDALRSGSETIALLARPDALGDEMGHALARVTLPEGARGGSTGSDPFADPLGYGRGDAMLVRGATAPAVVYTDRTVLRASDIEHGELHNGRSLLGAHPAGGGRILAHGHGAAEPRWIALATGFPENAGARVSPITLAALGPRAAVTGVTSAFPDDPGAIGERASVASEGSRVLVLYSRTERDGALAWMAAQANCTASGAAPAATTTPTTPTTTTTTRRRGGR